MSPYSRGAVNLFMTVVKGAILLPESLAADTMEWPSRYSDHG
jgi:hypothetical protein